jgi:hypothetical protein
MLPQHATVQCSTRWLQPIGAFDVGNQLIDRSDVDESRIHAYASDLQV